MVLVVLVVVIVLMVVVVVSVVKLSASRYQVVGLSNVTLRYEGSLGIWF